MDYRMRNACRNGDLEYIKNDIEQNRAIYIRDKDKIPHPLFFCASGGRLDCIRYVLKSLECDIELIIESISIAAMSGHKETVEFLLGSLKNFNRKHPRLLAALNNCITLRKTEMAKLLIEWDIFDEDVEDNAFINSAKAGDIDITKLLMTKFSDYRQYMAEAIHISINRGHRNSVNFLYGQELV